MSSLHIRALQAAQGTEVENTTTETSMSQYAFLAGTLTPGKLYMISGGMIVIDNNSTDTATLRLRLGTNATTPASNTNLGASAAVDVVDNDYATVSGFIHVVSATRAVATVYVQAPDATGVEAVYGHTTVLAIAQGTDYYLDWTAEWSVAHADNELASEAFAVVELI